MAESRISNINKPGYKITLRNGLTAMILLLSGVASAQDTASQANDSTATVLSEVTVEAKREVHTADADIIYLSEKNREFGTNALDAISSLRQFSPVIDGMELKTVAQKDVFILINGRPSSARELRGYTGKEIRKVTFYPQAPARYSNYTDGPLADVTVRADRDYIHTFVSASNSLNVAYGTNQAVVRWADSLNLVRADYFIDYRDLTYDNRELYLYPRTPALDRNYRTGSGYRGNFQQGNLSWQSTAHGNTLYLSAGITHNPTHRRYNGTSLQGEGRAGEEETYSRTLESLTDRGNLNFYFTRNFSGRWLEIQATGTVGKTTSENLFGSGAGDDTNSSNRAYSGYGRVMYYTPGKVNLFLTGTYSYQHVDHRQILPASYRYSSDNDGLNLSTDINGQFVRDKRRLSYSVGVTLNRDHIRVGHIGVDRTDWRLKPHINLTATLSEKFLMRLRASITSGIPTVGMFSEVPTFQESNLVWRGNAGLKGWTTYTVRWLPQFTSASGKFSLNGDFCYYYISRPVRSCVTGEKPVEIKYMNLDNEKNTEAVLFLNITPLKKFAVKPYMQWNHSAYRTPSREVNRGYFRYGGSVVFNSQRVQAVANVNAPYKTFSGDITEYGGWQLSCSVLVKLPAGFSASLRWNRSYQGDRTTIQAPGLLDYTGVTKIPRLANQITLGLTWSFSHGFFRNRYEAELKDVDPDTGISVFNKAKM